METIYLGKWGNYDICNPKRGEEFKQVLDAVDKHGAVRVSFNYIGFTKEELVGRMMLNEAEELGYTGTVGYRNALVIYGREQAND